MSAGSSLSPKSSVYSLWTDIGAMNEESSDAKSLEAGTLPFKSPLVDVWDNLTIRAVIYGNVILQRAFFLAYYLFVQMIYFSYNKYVQ